MHAENNRRRVLQMPLSSHEKHALRIIFRMFDRDRSDSLEFEEFHRFLQTESAINLEQFDDEHVPKVLPTVPINKEYAAYMFKGIDINGSNSAAIDEIMRLVEAIKDNDVRYQAMMSFRAVDSDRNGLVDVNAIKTAANTLVPPQTELHFKHQAKAALGYVPKELTFAQYYKVLTGIEVPSDTDPYEGHLPPVKKSECCLLI